MRGSVMSFKIIKPVLGILLKVRPIGLSIARLTEPVVKTLISVGLDSLLDRDACAQHVNQPHAVMIISDECISIT
jgi:hypothetical protein